MYCTNCGKEIRNNARFCSTCGAERRMCESEAKQYLPASTRQAMNPSRSALISEIDRLLSLFESVKASYGRLQYLNNGILRKQHSQTKRGWLYFSLAYVLLGCITAVGLIIWCYSPEGYFASSDLLQHEKLIVVALVSLLLLAEPILLLVIVILVRAIRKRSVRKMSKEAADIYRALQKHYAAIPENPLAFEYCSPYYLAAIRELMFFCRANSYIDAINLIENPNYPASGIIEQAREAKNAIMVAASYTCSSQE